MTQQLKPTPHHRMTLEDVYLDYQAGMLSAKGAVFYAIAASRRFGEPVQFNVSEFLERTGMHRGSYSRAVATLIQEGRLDYPPNATQTLRVPVLPGTSEPSYYSLTASRSQICDRNQQICDIEKQICDRNQQICDIEKQICDRKSSEVPLEANSEIPLSNYYSIDLSLSVGERDEKHFEEEYLEWLTRKAQDLPTPPILLETWIEKNKDRKSNRKQFFNYKKAVEEAKVPQPAEPAIFEVKNEQQQRLETLSFWWEDGAREKVKATIAAHPEWRLQVGATGVEVMES